MKKIAVILGSAIFMSIVFSSCKKTYDCECTFSDGYKTTVNSSAKMTQKDAVNWCEGQLLDNRICKLL